MKNHIKYFFNIDNIKDKCRISFVYSYYHDLVVRGDGDRGGRTYKRHKKQFLANIK